MASSSGAVASARRRVDPERRVIAVTRPRTALGALLIERLEADRRYAAILAVDTEAPPARPGNRKAEFARIDLAEGGAAANMARLLRDRGVDTVVHLDVDSNPTRDAGTARARGVDATTQVLAACHDVGLPKIVMAGLTAVYGAHPDNPGYLTERDAARGVPGSALLAGKVEAERGLLRFAADYPETVVTLLRMAAIVGPAADNFVTAFLARPVVPVLMGYDPLVQLIHEDDACAALKLCVDADFRGQFNIAADGVLPLRTLLAMCGRIALPLPSSMARRLAKAMWLTRVAASPPVWLDFLRYPVVVDTAQSIKALGFSPRHDIRDTVAEFARTVRRPIEARARQL